MISKNPAQVTLIMKIIQLVKKLDKIYNKKFEDLRIRSKCDWYKKGEKSTKSFLNLETRHAIQNDVKIFVINSVVVKEEADISKNLYCFY